MKSLSKTKREPGIWLTEVDTPDIGPEVAVIFDPLGNAVHVALSFDLAGGVRMSAVGCFANLSAVFSLS
jgi:hypothetical protein